MTGSPASFRSDGSCRYTDVVAGTDRVWRSVSDWATDWFDEWRTREPGDAVGFINAAIEGTVAGTVQALVGLAESCDGDAQRLSWVGAGPLEDLLSHSGHGALVLPEVDRAARQSPAFRAALGYVWIGDDLPPNVRDRLGELGARILGPN